MANKPKIDNTGEAGANTYPQSSTAHYRWSDDELTVSLDGRVERLEIRMAALEAEWATPRLMLYVWENVLCDHSCGIAFALAHDSEEARKMILDKLGYEHADLSRAPQVFDPTGDPVAFYSYGGG